MSPALMEFLGPLIGAVIVVLLNRWGIKLPMQPGPVKPDPVDPVKPVDPSNPEPVKPNTPLLDGLRQLLDILRARREEDAKLTQMLSELTDKKNDEK